MPSVPDASRSTSSAGNPGSPPPLQPGAPVPETATVRQIGEFGLIEGLRQRFTQGPHVFLGPGDDAAVVRTSAGHAVISTDLLVEGQHFRRDWASAADVGRKAVAQNVSDINAMGGRAHTLVVGLVLPTDTPASWVLEMAEGMAAEAAAVGASIVGGDVTQGREVVIAVTVLGACETAPVRRDGARPGDVLALAGRQGWSAAGMAVLARGFRSPRVVVEAHRHPEPPYEAGPAAAAAGASAMIDVSDGLVADVGHLAHQSEVAIDIHASSFSIDEPLQAVGSALGSDPLRFVLTGGEDHALVATFPADAALPDGWRAIGRVTSGTGVTVDGEAYAGVGGHRHF